MRVTRLRFHLDSRMVGEVARGSVDMPQLGAVGASATPQREDVEGPTTRQASLDLAALKAMDADGLRRVIACATKLLELEALVQGEAAAAIMNGRQYGRRRADLRDGAPAH